MVSCITFCIGFDRTCSYPSSPGGPIDLQGFAESCWNNLKIVDIDLDGTKRAELSSILAKPHLQDSGTSSLNDEDQSSVSDNDANGHYKPPISVKALVEKFSPAVNIRTDTGKWNLVVQELIETESAYLSSLKEIEEGYLNKFTRRFHDHEEIKIIFSNWKRLCCFHSEFLARMTEATARGFTGLSDLALCFISAVDTFEELYSDYCMNYSKSINHLKSIENLSSDAWQYLIGCQNRLGHQLPLSTFLLKPVQRILKYQLLLQELAHSCQTMTTKERDVVIQSLFQAIKRMIDVAIHINERQTQQDELNRQKQLRNELYAEILLSNSSFPDLGFPFFDGELKESGSRHPRVALLCQHALVLAKRVGNGRWDIKQIINCEKMMLFEYIPKQPLGFYMVDLNNPKSKSKVQAVSKEDKDVWCTKIKELIIGSYDAGLISERLKRILLEKKDSAFSVNEMHNESILETHRVQLNPEEEELLDLETTLRRMLDPAPETKFMTSRNLGLKRRNSLGVDKTDSSMNFRDPSIYQKKNRRHLEVDSDMDCRSITVEINEEALREEALHGGGVVSMQIQTYERYIEVARTKIRLTPEDIDEIFLPLRQLSMAKDSGGETDAPLADIEMIAFCSDQESTASDLPVLSDRHRKSASMDRTYGLLVCQKTSSPAYTVHTDPGAQAKEPSEGGERKRSLFSSVRGTKSTRSKSEWSGLGDSDIKPGIVSSISKLFRASSRFGRRDKTATVFESKSHASPDQPHKSQLNKSNSTDHIVHPQFLSPKSHFGKKCKAPLPPTLAQMSRMVREELEDCEFAHPTKPPRKLQHGRADLCSSAEVLGPKEGSVPLSTTAPGLVNVRGLVSVFQAGPK